MSNYISWLQQEMEIRQLTPNGMTQQAMEEKAGGAGEEEELLGAWLFNQLINGGRNES